MTIQRQYSLPNCKLILEGLTTDNPLEVANLRPVVSVVTNVECHLAGYKQPLSGGRDFLESLVRAVSEYAQDYLSGIPHAIRRDRHDPGSAVQFHRIEKNLHRLSVQPQAGGEQSLHGTVPAELDLTTVQLFDLVEAVDQFLADAQTLPDMTLKLKPLSKRFVVSQEPIAKRAVPAAVGVSGLAVAAVGLFFIPAPVIQRPEPTSGSTSQASPSPVAASPSASASPNSDTNVTPTTSPESSDSASPTTSPTTSAASSSATSSPNPGDTSAILETAGNISDPDELDRLTQELQSQLYEGWEKKPTPTFTQPLQYRVGVDENGEIAGYKFVNDDALTYLNEVPLSDLQFPTPAPDATPKSLAQFLVIFKPDGVMEISPWYGLPPDTTTRPAEQGQ
ncbi:MAG TPA: DUF4335 domain-containing protein [Allocoleopsis sp.]